MSYEKANKVFPEMPEQPIVKNQPCGCWFPTDEVQLMILAPLVLLLLAVAAYYAYANLGGAEAFNGETRGFKWPWEYISGMKMPWQ